MSDLNQGASIDWFKPKARPGHTRTYLIVFFPVDDGCVGSRVKHEFVEDEYLFLHDQELVGTCIGLYSFLCFLVIMHRQ
jgi:hypothetical protein